MDICMSLHWLMLTETTASTGRLNASIQMMRVRKKDMEGV